MAETLYRIYNIWNPIYLILNFIDEMWKHAEDSAWAEPTEGANPFQLKIGGIGTIFGIAGGSTAM